MSTSESGDMSRHSFQIAYDGGPASGHSMDVEALGPALLAVGRLIREANTVLNEKRATVKVLVTSDFEHKCFNVNFEVVQSILQHLKTLLQDENVQTATKLLQTIGMVGSAGTAVAGLFGFLKWKKGRKIETVKRISDVTATGSVVLQIQIEGDGNSIQIPESVLRLAENQKILRAVKETLEPIELREAERIEFRQADTPQVIYDGEAAVAIVRSCDAGPDDAAVLAGVIEQPKSIVATLYSHGPVFDEKAKNWRFRYGKKAIYADVSDTNIAKDAVKRGSSFMNDRYRVRMQITPPETDDGTPHYKITEVLDFSPAQQQMALPLKRRAIAYGRGRGEGSRCSIWPGAFCG
ncbi:hypothetical protein AAFX91_40430, partial [Bradyrhizobium sp. 31Argb]|uniref:hypothetical protein n=1 Tax=Bradyrhizobium sp. 31Argb TaxID=3141247 RepID=UPI003748BFFA